MKIISDETIFKSSYFKNICPGYEQFFEPEKLFSRLTDDPLEIKRRQDILCDLFDNPVLFEDLCFFSEAIMQFKSAFDDMPNHDLGDFRLNLACFGDADGAVGLLDLFLQTAHFTQRYSWLSGFAKGVNKLNQTHCAEKLIARWKEIFVPEEHMHSCDFGFNFDDILWPVNYKLLAMRKEESTKKNTPYQIQQIKIPLSQLIPLTLNGLVRLFS